MSNCQFLPYENLKTPLIAVRFAADTQTLDAVYAQPMPPVPVALVMTASVSGRTPGEFFRIVSTLAFSGSRYQLLSRASWTAKAALLAEFGPVPSSALATGFH